MSNIKTTFEKELRTRLAQKAKPNQPEDALLIKAMKFFDLNNSGTVSKDEFSKALDRLGVNSYNEQQLSQLFAIYDLDNSGELDYKEFASILFGTPRSPTKINKKTVTSPTLPTQQQSQSQNQNQEQHQKQEQQVQHPKISHETTPDFDDPELVDSLITLKETLQKRGTTGILGLARMFRIADDNNNKNIEFEEFYKVLRDYQVDLSLVQVQKLFSFFDKDRTGHIDYDELLLGIRGKLNPFRKSLVEKAFAKLDSNRNGLIEVNDIQNVYDTSKHPDVINGKKRPSDILEEFLKTFENFSYYKGKVDSVVTLQEFEDYYGFISASIDDDRYFELMMNNVWKLDQPTEQKGKPLEETKSNELVVNEYSQLQGNIAFTIKRLKQRLSPRGCRAFIVLHKLLRVLDSDNDGLITQREFLKAFKENRLEIADQDARAIVEYYDHDNKGLLPIQNFMRDLVGELSISRKEIVETAWNTLNGSQQGQVDVGTLKNAFKDQRNHPDAKSGRKTDMQVTDEYTEAWDIYHNFITKPRKDYVTKQEFVNFLLYLNGAIEDDEYFRVTVQQTFKIRPESRQNTWAGMTGGRKDYDPKTGYVQNMHTSFYSGRTFTSSAPFGTSEEHANPYQEPPKTTPKKPNKFDQQDEEKVKSRGSAQQQSTIFSGISDKDLLEQLRRKIISRGTRGIIGIARVFKNIDDDNSKTISFEEFDKALKDFRLSVVEEDAQKIFNVLDLNKNGTIDYNEFLRMITGEMNETRKKIVIGIFERLDKDKSGFITVEDIRELYNARQHPDVKTGKKSEDEVLMEFLETFEQHHNIQTNNTKDSSVSLEEFIEYYNNISCSIDDDRYFEMMMNNCWNPRNYQKGWRGDN